MADSTQVTFKAGMTVKIRGLEPSKKTILTLGKFTQNGWWEVYTDDRFGTEVHESWIEHYTPPYHPKKLTADVLLAELRKKAAEYPVGFTDNLLYWIVSDLRARGYVIPEATE